jgi:hypothetical protein
LAIGDLVALSFRLPLRAHDHHNPVLQFQFQRHPAVEPALLERLDKRRDQAIRLLSRDLAALVAMKLFVHVPLILDRPRRGERVSKLQFERNFFQTRRRRGR